MIIITVMMIGIVGLLVGLGLVYAGKKFYVEKDERETAVRNCLPGNNCGACGFAGCDALASAIVKGDAHVSSCTVGGQIVADNIGKIMGIEALGVKKKVAFVRCNGTCDSTKSLANYIGIHDCNAVVKSGVNIMSCDYGCLGFASCVNVCPENAISIIDGVARVNRKKCIGCGLCVKACPKTLIELIPSDKFIAVKCSSKDKGLMVKKICSVGCIGCSLCQKQCENNAIQIVDNLAHIDYDKCISCAKCAQKCPANAIVGKSEKNL